MVDVNALLNMDITKVKDVYMGVQIENGRPVFYVFAFLKNELYKYDIEIFATCFDYAEASGCLVGFKNVLERMRKEAADVKDS